MATTLDHIVILISPETLANLPPWLTNSFTITPGGRHSNNITENKLILFQDGVYIELIAFIEGTSPDIRKATRWGRREEGEVVDFALTLLRDESKKGTFNPEEVFEDGVQKAVAGADTGFTYQDPVPGGRVTPDGVELRWAVAVPKKEGEGPVEGELPFWCLDRTPRNWRVPFRDVPGRAEHASGVVGVAGVEVLVKGGERFKELVKAYAAFLGEGVSEGSSTGWKLGAPEGQRLGGLSSLKVTLSGEKPPLTQDGTDDGLVRISLKLFTTGASKTISGEIAPGKTLSIKLIHTNP
ncbi:glyoxalase-like domain-containing protein [Cercophora newfieldiana]|uniref:Glyoxalase-like domain-containing protein n=1 Tax=Cercophora newfieldiana TaxID=92897 RepID=A0AA40CTH4_9PEZI|nr:glyoxalase-like domain-containing protein [Cercophora newfieldiana]